MNFTVVQALHPGDPSVLAAIAATNARAGSAQAARPAAREFTGL